MSTDPGSRRRFAASALAAGCALLIAACGSSAPGAGQTGTTASTTAALTRFSACMRSHGVPSFPDPSSTQSGDSGFGIDGYSFNLPANLDTQSPAYKTAYKACFAPLAAGGGGSARDQAFVAKARQAGLARARCMRAHGVPNFPDPKITVSGGSISSSSGAPGINPRSPAFQRAQKICGGGAPAGGGG
jgi:hypothetical protein